MESLEAPAHIFFPAKIARQFQGMMREARAAKAFTGVTGPNELHVTFDEKPRLTGIGVSMLMLDSRSLRVSVINLHVGPWSSRDALARRFVNAGVHVQELFSLNSMTVISTLKARVMIT